VSSSDALPSLIVASLDLQLVRLLRDAMNNGGGDGAVPGLGPAPSDIERRFRVEPEPEFLPRRRIEPEPRVEPRQVIRPADRYEPGAACDPCAPAPLECYAPCKRTRSSRPGRCCRGSSRRNASPPPADQGDRPAARYRA
jgi:hypothetical protein